MALLLERWVQSQEGRGQVVLLRGEAGIGKSRLVEALRERARRREVQHALRSLFPYYQNSALYPVIDLQRFLQWQRDDARGEVDTLERVRGRIGAPGGRRAALCRCSPCPAGALSCAEPDAPTTAAEDTGSLVAWLLEEAERQPVLAVWEDLHTGRTPRR